jgi:hypothetical protein
MPTNTICVAASGGEVRFPCDISAPVVVSIGIITGGIALLFTIYLTFAVSKVQGAHSLAGVCVLPNPSLQTVCVAFWFSLTLARVRHESVKSCDASCLVVKPNSHFLSDCF